MAKAQIQSLRGMNDVFPPEASHLQQLHDLIHAVLARYAYRPLQLPLLEQTGLFKRAVGEETDVVSKEMYTFCDRNDESITLRPEATAGVVRAMIQHGKLQQPQRVYAEGPMFRYERPQKGRSRQFSQVSVEAFGMAGAALDAELIAICADLFRRLGVLDLLTLELNTIGLAEERHAFQQALVAYLQNHLDALDDDSRRRLTTNPLRILDSKNAGVQAVLDGAPALDDYLGAESRAHFARLTALLDAQGIAWRRNPRLVRGLDYYCHTVFEWTTDALGAQGTVTAGGATTAWSSNWVANRPLLPDLPSASSASCYWRKRATPSATLRPPSMPSQPMTPTLRACCRWYNACATPTSPSSYKPRSRR